MNKGLLHAVSAGSLEGTLTFPQVVQMLSKEDVESYRVDLVQKLKTFYMPDGEVYSEHFDYIGPTAGTQFLQDQVIEAIKAIQNSKIKYREFLDQILRAGTTSYSVYIKGSKAIYFGRNGDFHVENFPGPGGPTKGT
ncbi:MAG: DUF1398 family protein [Bdellovibrionales bacterium]